MIDLSDALATRFGDPDPRELVVIECERDAYRAYAATRDLDLYSVLLDPSDFVLMHGLDCARRSLSDAAKREQSKRRRELGELAELERKARNVKR